MAYEIRELSLTGILNQAFVILGDHFLHLLLVASILTIPIGLLAVGFQPDQGDPFDLEAPVVQVDPAIQIISGILGILGGIASILTNAAIINSVADAYVGKQPTVGRSFGRAFGRFFPILGTSILVAIAIMGGFILLIIPGIIAILWFSLATQVVVLEPKGGFNAMKRSRQLMKGNIGKFIGLGILIFIIQFGILTAVGSVALMTGSVEAATILNVVASVFQVMLYSAIIVVFYFSARCQHDNFDLEVLAASISEEPVAEPAM